MKTSTLVVLVLLVAALAAGGGQKPLDHSVYAVWKTIRGETISADGKWAAYALEPGEGDPILVVTGLESGRTDTVLRGSGCKFSDDGRFAAFLIRPSFAVLKKARIDKKKPDDMPKDSLGIMDLSSRAIDRIPRVKSFAFPQQWSGWIAYQLEKPLPAKPDSARARTKDTAGDAADGDATGSKAEGTTAILRELATGREWKFPGAGEYLFSKTGSRFLVSVAGGDSTASPGVFSINTSTAQVETLAIGAGKYTQIALDEAGTQAAFLADRDTSKVKQRSYALYWWAEGQDSASRIVDTLTAGMKPRWLVSEHGDVRFSHLGKKIFFGTAPIPVPDDTTFNDEETAQLDVWHWQDAMMQPEQLKNLEKEKKRSYTAVWHIDRRAMVQLGDVDLPDIEPGDRGDANISLGSTELPYLRERMWTGVTAQDVFVVDDASGTRIRLLEKARDPVLLSPAAKYVAYYDYRKRHWFAVNVATLRTTQVTRDITVPLYDELDDHPDDPGPHGQAGWTEGDRRFLVYDRYDLWSTDPSGKEPSVCMTAGNGRKNTTRYRFVRLDPEERALKEQGGFLVRLFQEKDKQTGFALASAGTPMAPRPLANGPYQFGMPQKARNDSVVIFTRGNFQEFPDLYAGDLSFAHPRRISTANAQQADYAWGSVELISWKPADGKPLEGLLFKPPQFDPRKKYPMIVYYYERDSDLLHQHRAPLPSRSTVNPSFYSSRGYVIFIPDIRYRVGHPGKSALEAIVSGTRAVLAKGFVDKERIGLQGQSWGGYETAYLITQTPMFRAAMAGAPVANMTSAYGGIRWESGWSRAWQYEKAQSRIGSTLWGATPLYLENSPLFSAPRVTTPLLIMHNDADGAVPWYQGIELFSALRRLNKPVWMLTYNNEEHNLTKWKNRKDLSVRMAQFFDHYLKGEPMPDWMARGRSALEKTKTMGTGPGR